MKKFFAILFSVFFVITAVLFFLILNFKSGVLSAESLKKIALNANAETIISTYIKDEIISTNKLDINDVTTFEQLNSKVNSAAVISFFDGTVDQIFTALKDPNSMDTKFNVSFPEGAKGQPIYFEKTVNLENNLGFWVISKANSFLLLTGILTALFLFFSVLLGGSNLGERFSRFGGSSLTLGILLGLIISAQFYLVPHYFDVILSKIDFVKDAKLVNGMRKILTESIGSQLWSYIIESVSFVSLGIVSFFIAKGAFREKVAKIEDKL